ncbi:TolC family protein [Pedobacter immunditicola]|uniref:TolC family protein n=1 Tax=Pedobacter immunditicola TaxID=3133440 RepID=UPI0030A34248
MFYRLLLLSGILIFPIFAAAQDAPAKLRLSLDEARALAIKNNPVLQAKDLDIQISKEVTAQAKLKRIPQVYGDFNLQRNLIIPVTPVPANAFNPDAAEGELLPLRFSTKWTANTGINASIDLFNPLKKQEVKEAGIQEGISKLEKEKEENRLYFDVSNAYAMALISMEQLNLSIADTLTKTRILKMSQEQFEAGRLTLTELNVVKSDLNNTLSNYEETLNISSNAMARLVYYIGFDPAGEVSIELSDDIERLFMAYQEHMTLDSSQSYAYKNLQQNELLIATQINGAKAGYLPVLTFNAFYGANYFDNNFKMFKSANWTGNSFMNVGVSVPITQGLDRQKKINQLKLQKVANELAYKDQLHKNRLDFLEATRDADFYGKKYKRMKENYQLAGDNFQIAEEQFEKGRLLIADLYKANYSYQQEKTNYLNVAYDFILAKIKIYNISRN